MSRAAAIAAALALGLAAAALAAGAEAPLPRLGPAPNFALTTQQNDRLWLTQLRHRVVVLTFTCTACQACPGVLPFLSGLARDLRDAAGRAVFFVVVTVDPARDSAPVLRRFARDRRLDPVAWLLLTGKPSEIDVVTRWYGVAVHRQDGGVSHDCLVVLIDGGGTIRGRYGLDDLAQLRRGVDALRAEGTGS